MGLRTRTTPQKAPDHPTKSLEIQSFKDLEKRLRALEEDLRNLQALHEVKPFETLASTPARHRPNLAA